jgi:hypothetical protein
MSTTLGMHYNVGKYFYSKESEDIPVRGRGGL